MEEIPLREARDRLGAIHARVNQGEAVKITRHGAYGVVMMSERDFQRYVEAARELDSYKIREAIAQPGEGDRAFSSTDELHQAWLDAQPGQGKTDPQQRKSA